MTKMTREEKVAVQLMTLISDIRLDITMIGMYIAKFSRKGEWLRLEHIFHTADEEQRLDMDRNHHYAKMEEMGRHN